MRHANMKEVCRYILFEVGIHLSKLLMENAPLFVVVTNLYRDVFSLFFMIGMLLIYFIERI